MSNRLTILAAAALAAASATAAGAQSPGSDRRLAAVETRDARQGERIAGGVAGDQLTTRETARLDRQQAGIDRTEARLAADGNFSRRDYARVSRRENHASRAIYRDRHNGRQ